jgi:coproporphyrinogen III oxidase
VTEPLKDRMVRYIQSLQNEIVTGLEKFERSIKFQKIDWKRGSDGGGGDTRVISGGEVFEKGGVNTSVVHGDLPQVLVDKLGSKSKTFFATGLSLVLHPRSPQIPTIHANFRYFEQPDRAWFGGGLDLTPYTVSEEDFKHFHRTLKKSCDGFSSDAYAQYKKECDTYFHIVHRKETRGIGGIFFDYLEKDLERTFEFVQNCGNSFLDSYSPIVARNLKKTFTDRQKKFQLLRRGRYVEFNLVYDRGTLFGLQTSGNTESILMSLPPEVHFDFASPMNVTDEEKKLTSWFQNPRDWI